MGLRCPACISSYHNTSNSTGNIFRHLYKHLRLGDTDVY